MKSLVPAEQELKRAKEDEVIENARAVMYDTLMQLAQQMGMSDAIPAQIALQRDVQGYGNE